MKSLQLRKRSAAARRAVLSAAGFAGIALASAFSLLAQGASTSGAPAKRVVTASLDYQDASFNYVNEGLSTTLKSSPFKKEPALSRGKVVRGTWQLGGDASHEIAFVWDRGARKLYVDLNRNLDLTDDPGGVYSSGAGGVDYFQTFPNVKLPVQAGVGSRVMLADLNCYDYGPQPNFSAGLHSYWQGKVTLQGQDWQVGLLGLASARGVSFVGGNLLLRPWSERTRLFSLYNGSLATVPFSAMVFFGERAYALQCNSQNTGNMVVQFTEQTPKLGELKIAGSYVQRAILGGGPYQVVLDQPAGVIKVPVGSYTTAQVSVRRGNMEAYLEPQFQSAGRLKVSETTPAVLQVGGPLTNAVSVARRGKYLALNYRLTGLGGGYQLVNQDRAHPPEFTVYHGDKKVASGKFEFG
jgi:hypothetical protein